MKQSKSRLSCDLEMAGGDDTDGYGFSRNDFNRPEQQHLEMAVKTRTRLGNKMQTATVKTV